MGTVDRSADKAEQLLNWILPRLTGDKATTIAMIQAYHHDAYNEGIADAADMVQGVYDRTADPQRRHVLKIISNALKMLEKLNRETEE